MKPFQPVEIEKHWGEVWEKEKTFKVDLKTAKNPYYNLMMFPYPSGEGLHVGHVYAFGGADTFGHFMKMKGHDVFEPMGFDSFGIHSENYAIKVGKHPKKLIEETTKYFKEEQLQKLGALFDWDHSVTTSDTQYYRWTQWIFVQLFKAGLAVRKKAAVDWCPSCKTVLADEQVVAGKCERCGTSVIQKELEQWFFKITDYAQKLLDNLETIDWSETTKTMQKNWIGRSQGAEINFPVSGSEDYIKIFTTRADTVFGATFMVIAPEHPILDQIVSKDYKEKVSRYISEAKNKSEVERTAQKSGIFTGAYAVNPFNKKKIPIYTADYVLGSYGTGAIMAVPAHDQRDYEFAKKYDLAIVEVISGGVLNKKAWEGDGVLVNSGEFNGLGVEEAKKKLSEYIEENKIGSKTVNFHLRDWLISRQRYWGPPIPMIYCKNCASQDLSWFTREEAKGKLKDQGKREACNSQMSGWYPVVESELPVVLPELEDYQPKGAGVSPLSTVPEFLSVKCPSCGEEAKRETDVSDTFLDSAWYFLRYPSVGQDSETASPFNQSLSKKWLPPDMYIGGNEHAVLHLLYSRFITMALHDLGYLDFEEPYKKFRAHALITYKGAKMSKSRGNVVNPNEYLTSYGADTLKMYLLFIGPYDQGGDFSDRAIAGMFRFLQRVWTLTMEIKESSAVEGPEIKKQLHKLIKEVGEDLDQLKFNTSIAHLMEFINFAYKNKSGLSLDTLKYFVVVLAPFAPFLSEELWHELGEKGSVHLQAWPKFEPSLVEETRVSVVVQVNGKYRDKIEVEKDLSEEEVGRLVLDREKIKSYTDGKHIEKTIYVKNRLFNLVVS